MNAFYSFVDRVVDEQAEMSANELSINQIKDVDMKASSRKVIQPQHLAIVKKNATKAIEQFIEAAKRKEITEAAQDKLNGTKHISRQDSHQSGNYASLNIDVENDTDETTLEKGLSIVSKDWETIIELEDTAEELKSKIETLESLDRLDVKGRLAQVNGAISIYITETRKARVLEWIQWRREELEAAEAEEETETTSGEEEFSSLKGVDIQTVVESDNENETTSKEEQLGVPTGVDIEMVAESDDEEENADSDQDSGVSETGAVEEDVDNRRDASSHSDDSKTEEAKLETAEKSTHTVPIDSTKAQEASSPALSQAAGPEAEIPEPTSDEPESAAKVETVDNHASEDQKTYSAAEDSSRVKYLTRSQKRKQKKAARKAQEEANLAATPWTDGMKIQYPIPASKKTKEKKIINAKAATRRAIGTISGPDNIAIAFEFNEACTQVTIDIVLSDPDNIDLLGSHSDTLIPITTSLNIYYPNHDAQFPNHPYAVTSCDISSATVSELLQIASILIKARGYLTAKRDNYVWTEAVKRKFHSKATSKVLTMPVINRAKLGEVPEMEVLASAPGVHGSGEADEVDGGEEEESSHSEEDADAGDGGAEENSGAKDGGDEEGNDGGHFSILDLLRGLHHTWDDMGAFGWLALGFLVWFFLAYIGGYQGGELGGKH